MERAVITLPVIGHGVATFLLAANTVAATLLPLIALRSFGADTLQVLLITAAVPTLFTTSIFWQALLRRVSLRRYILIQWAVGVVPFALMGVAREFWQLFVCHLVVATGFAAWTPLSGILLRRLYRESIRGRAFGVLNALTLLSQVAVYVGAGRLLTSDPEAFRWLLPVIAIGLTLGMIITASIAAGGPDGPASAERRSFTWRGLLDPVFRMHKILAADRRFMRYESAFMTYGCGFMICDALLPLLVTHRLGLQYDQITNMGFAMFRGCMLLAALPAGWLLDRIGPMRTAMAAFLGLTFYPLLLLGAGDAAGLAGASLLYGMMMAGVNLAWMLGPVTLAGSAERVGEYVAIHTTLVGVRGILFQTAGMLLYRATGMYAPPLLLAAAAFTWAAWQMWRLHVLEARPADAASGVDETARAPERKATEEPG